MDSYRVGGICSGGLQQGYAQPARPTRIQNNGSYGLSIRVQGIDGHPYVVLNNQDRIPPNPHDSNGHVEPDGSFLDNYQDYDFRGLRESHSDSPFVEYRSQMQFGGPHNGVKDTRKQSTLLNFQKHPELLKPYDPESNTLENFHSLPTRPVSLAEKNTAHQSSLAQTSIPPASHMRSSSLDQPRGSAALTQPGKMQAQPQALPKMFPSKVQSKPQQPQQQPQTKHKVFQQHSAQAKPPSPLLNRVPQLQTLPLQRVPLPQACKTSSPTSTQTVKPPSSGNSARTSLEQNHSEPDVLPLCRVDSSGPVLQSTPRSRNTSTSSTATNASAPRPPQDELEALYADTINRHENRRYIPFQPGTGRDIDTGSIPAVGELISKFDGKEGSQRRGRAGRRNRIHPEDRKRSRSVDSALPFGLRGDAEYLDEVNRNRGRSNEHVLRPSQLSLQKSSGGSAVSRSLSLTLGRRSALTRGSSAPVSPQGTLPGEACTVLGYKKPLVRSSFQPKQPEDSVDSGAETASKTLTSVASTSLSKLPRDFNSAKKANADVEAQSTPDLLKGQQELSQQTHEETAKQILFNYLRDGSNDNDDTTKRKVNLVFEKIQTLKSRAAGSVQADSNTQDLATHTKALQDQKANLEQELATLRKDLQHEAEKQKSLVEAQEKAGEDVRELQKDLEQSRDECAKLMENLAKTEADLRTTLEELFQVKMEREQYQTEIRDLQEQLSEMHDELDGAKRDEADSAEKQGLLEDFMQLKLDFQDVMVAKEEQEELLRRRERELTALKGALKEEVATHDQEVDRLKEQYEKEIRKLQTNMEEAKQTSAAVSREKADLETARGSAEGRLGRLTQEAERLRKRAQELENEVAKLNRIIDEAKLQETRLGERVNRLEREKQQLEESLAEVREEEEEMSRANKALTMRLEDVQRNLTRMSGEHRELGERLKDEKSQKEQFKNTKNRIEEERRLLDRTVEKLQREMNDIVQASQTSTQELQDQIDLYKEKNRRELSDLQRQLRERSAELEKSRQTTRSLQEEVNHLEEDLCECKRERDEAVLQVTSLEQKVFDLEVEAETRFQTKDDKGRQVKLMEERIAQLELDLDEERQSGDLLMDRIDRGREQVEQMRAELLQERGSRQDLESDKVSLERQNKDLKSRVAHLESSQKSGKEGLVAQLESRIQELEERLEAEERERASLQLVNRRLERKVKEMVMQVDEDHHSLQDQKDQLNLRLKALKRQMDEAEEEIDRLEHGKKKLQRELEEQQEANEQLQSQVKALRSEMRRKSTSAPILNDLDNDDDDDDISTDGETYFSSSSGYKRSSSQDALTSTFTL
ncbi:cingulin-like protein 1 [Denticeps clupeoides]|uniref:Myosin tail domain-containing protein n=1 Tax=Denticeps clupeoides TaxID=299321 RepID=A0AAY4B5J5_9TELE|nr:cingulin-like protein 1 [Denticeps clupeoides]